MYRGHRTKHCESGMRHRTGSRITSPRPYTLRDVGCILPRRETNRVGVRRQHSANLGCVDRTSSRITSRRPYTFCDVGCILPRWETNRVGVIRRDSENLGCVDRTGSRITSQRPYTLCDVGCILPRRETNRVGVRCESNDKTVRIWDGATGHSHIMVFSIFPVAKVLIVLIAYIQEPGSHTQSTLLSADGWLQQMCWLPPDKRSSPYCFHWASHAFATFDDQHALVLLQIT